MSVLRGALLVLLLDVIHVGPVNAFEQFVMAYREVEANTQHLYRVSCLTSGPESVCTLKVVSVRNRNKKSMMSCLINVDTLLENEAAKRTDNETFIVSSSRGACGYTNTYVFSKTGMVQTKTAPAEIPENLKQVCESFTPKTYNIPPNPLGATIFESVPLGKCPEINVIID